MGQYVSLADLSNKMTNVGKRRRAVSMSKVKNMALRHNQSQSKQVFSSSMVESLKRSGFNPSEITQATVQGLGDFGASKTSKVAIGAGVFGGAAALWAIASKKKAAAAEAAKKKAKAAVAKKKAATQKKTTTQKSVTDPVVTQQTQIVPSTGQSYPTTESKIVQSYSGASSGESPWYDAAKQAITEPSSKGTPETMEPAEDRESDGTPMPTVSGKKSTSILPILAGVGVLAFFLMKKK